MQPFEGIRVLDLTHVLAGPFCTFQLGVLGADVIKIEPVDRPDMTRDEGVVAELNGDLMGTYFLGQGAGKRALALDLKSADGRAVFQKLVGSADVLVQNYTTAAANRLGLDPETLADVNPRLIYCSMTGFGRTGPKAEHPAYDLVVQAWSGMMATNGWSPEDPPLRIGPPLIDYGTGAQAAMAISAALFQRERTGRGQVIDVAMADAAFLLMSSYVTDTLATGTSPRPHGSVHPKHAGYSAYETKEGWLVVGAYTNKQMADLMRALGFSGEADEILQTARADIGSRSAIDGPLIAEKLLQHSARYWEELLNAAHVPAARVRRIEETLAEEQVAARSVIGSYGEAIGRGGPDRLPVAGFSFAHGGPALSGPPPGFGEHSRAILAEVGVDDAAFDRLLEAGIVKG